MAAGKFFMYNTGLLNVLKRNINLVSGTLIAYPLHSGYTPSTASHSTVAQIAAFQATASATVVNAVSVTATITGSGNAVKFDLTDISGFSAAGDTFQAKYVAVVHRSGSASQAGDLLVGFCDLDTAASTGLEGTQVNVTWNASGVTKYNVNP